MRWRTWAAIAAVVVLILIFTSLLEAGRAKGAEPASNGHWHRTYMTWYGPHFYGNRTACGATMDKKLIGVAAHSWVPCGATVELRWKTHGVRHHRYAPVVDHCGCAVGSALDATARLMIHVTGHPPHSRHVHYRIFTEVW